MYDISSTQIDKKIIHKIGNKFREEPLVFSENLAPNTEEIDNLLLQNYLKPILNYNEVYELYHESNIDLNEINHFSKKIFENNDNFIEISKDIAKSLYSSSTHPNILLGELILIYYKDIRLNEKKLNGIGIYKTEIKDNYLDIRESGKNLILTTKTGISINKIQKGALILENGNVFAVDALNQKTKYWYTDFLKIKLKKTPENNAYIFKKVIQEIVSKVENPIEKIKLNEVLTSNFEQADTISVKEIKDLSKNYINNEIFDEIKNSVAIRENIELEDSDIISSVSLNKLTKKFRKKLNINNLVELTLKSENHFIEDIQTETLENITSITFKIITK